MATDDREQQFERALAKHLRNTPENACPDAEVLSAYHERTLSLEEMAKWKEHIAECERCQETLALVEQTENVDAEVWQEQNAMPLMDEHAATPEMVRTAAASLRLDSGAMPIAAAAAPVELPKHHPRTPWKWIVPVGAVAAGIIVWVGTIEIQKQQEQEMQRAVHTAENRQAPTPQPPLDLKTLPPPSAEPRGDEIAGKQELRDESKALHGATPAPTVPSASPSPRKIAPGAVAGARQELDKKKDATGEGRGYGNGVAASPAAAPRPAMTDDLARERSDAEALEKESNPAGAAMNAPLSRPSPAPAPPVENSRRATAFKSAAGKAGGVSTITGTVRDPSGAAVSGAMVTAVDIANGNSKTAVADAAGKFVLPDLPADQYKVVVAHAGFAASEQTLTLAPQQNEQLQVQLKIGAMTETVEVNGAAAAVNTQAADSLSANALPSSEVNALPLNGRGFQQLLKLAAADPRYIVAPDRKFTWRVGQGGKIERTGDQGKTWKLQSSGVAGDLRAGSATSDKVCWVVGKAGTILLTTDGGKHWKNVVSPITEDIGGIHATDAQHASIWDVPNRRSFQTSDGGVTWIRTANE